MSKLIDTLATIEHQQWMQWARTLMEKEGALSEERKERWRGLMVPYEELSEEWKEYDREWARKVLEVIKDQLSEQAEA
jgi:hypothetical protein